MMSWLFLEGLGATGVDSWGEERQEGYLGLGCPCVGGGPGVNRSKGKARS